MTNPPHLSMLTCEQIKRLISLMDQSIAMNGTGNGGLNNCGGGVDDSIWFGNSHQQQQQQRQLQDEQQATNLALQQYLQLHFQSQFNNHQQQQLQQELQKLQHRQQRTINGTSNQQQQQRQAQHQNQQNQRIEQQRQLQQQLANVDLDDSMTTTTTTGDYQGVLNLSINRRTERVSRDNHTNSLNTTNNVRNNKSNTAIALAATNNNSNSNNSNNSSNNNNNNNHSVSNHHHHHHHHNHHNYQNDSNNNNNNKNQNQSSNNIVTADAEQLERIRAFIEDFKIRRAALGLTQKQAAQCFRAYTDDRFAFSDNFIGHFEGFQFRPQTAATIAQSLAEWLQFVERETRLGRQLLFMPGRVKETRKRKFEVIRIRDAAKRVLVDAFEQNRSPSAVELERLSVATGIPTRNIEIWFKNRRTSQQYKH